MDDHDHASCNQLSEKIKAIENVEASRLIDVLYTQAALIRELMGRVSDLEGANK